MPISKEMIDVILEKHKELLKEEKKEKGFALIDEVWAYNKIMNEKYKTIQDKISSLSTQQNTVATEPNKKITKRAALENKVKDLDFMYKNSMKTLELKFFALKEHINKLKEYMEINAIKDDNNKTEAIENINILLKNYGNVLIDEESKNKIVIENIAHKIKGKIFTLQKEEKENITEMSSNTQSALDEISLDLPVITSKVKKVKEENESAMNDIKKEIDEEFKMFSDTIQSDNVNALKSIEDKKGKLKEISEIAFTEGENERKMRIEFRYNINKVMNEAIDSLNTI